MVSQQEVEHDKLLEQAKKIVDNAILYSEHFAASSKNDMPKLTEKEFGVDCPAYYRAVPPNCCVGK